MITAILAVVVLASGPTATANAPSNPSQTQALAALPAADEDIRRALFEMHARDPERVVCSARVQIGSRQPRTTCGTLRSWFDNRLPGEIQGRQAPWQLVEEIKDQRKKALMKGARGG